MQRWLDLLVGTFKLGCYLISSKWSAWYERHYGIMFCVELVGLALLIIFMMLAIAYHLESFRFGLTIP